jgi:hypothetical protein
MSNWLTDGEDWGDVDDAPAGGGVYTPVPKGDYECEVVSITTKAIDNANAIGLLIKVEVKIIDGDCKGRRIFGGHIINYAPKSGDSEKGSLIERIGRGKFKSLCGAVGIEKKTSDFTKLAGKAVKCSVVISKRGDGKEDNEIAGYDKSRFFVSVVKPINVGGFDPWA